MTTTAKAPLIWKPDGTDIDGSVTETAATTDFELMRTIRAGGLVDPEISLATLFQEFNGSHDEVAAFLWALAAQALELSCALRGELR